MKVYRNSTLIEKRERMGRRLSLAGLLVLFVGLLASFVPSRYPPGTVPSSEFGQFMQQWWSTIAFAALPIGFLFASAGSYFITRYARRRWPGVNQVLRPDELLERSLKGLNDQYTLFLYSLPVAYAVLTPTALVTLTVRGDKGHVRVQGDKWRERWSFGRILTLFAREGVGHPPSELADQANKMQQYLSAAPLAEGEVPVQGPIDGAVVFLNSDTFLDLAEPTVAILRADQLKDHLRKRTREIKAPAAQARAVSNYLQQNNTSTVKAEV
jgi:hypothetical protein